MDNKNQLPVQSQPLTTEPIKTFNQQKMMLIFIAIVILLVLGLGGYFLIGKNRIIYQTQNPQNMIAPRPVSEAKEESKFVYFEQVVVKPTLNILTDIGEYKNRFVIYDISSRTSKVFFEETKKEDNIPNSNTETFRLINRQYVSYGSKVININGQNVSNAYPNYPVAFSRNVSPSGRGFINDIIYKNNNITFSVMDKGTNEKKEITIPDQPGRAVRIIGWSHDEKSVFFILVSTHVSDPTFPIYQLEILTGTIKKFPRDESILGVKAEFIDSQRDEIYFVGENGLFVQSLTSSKAILVPIESFGGSEIERITFPQAYDGHYLAISNGKKLIIKDIDSGKENLVFEAHSDGNVFATSWKGNFIIYFFGKGGSTGNDQKYGYYDIGYIYDLRNEKSLEFVKHMTDSMFKVGLISFIGWL